MSEQSFEPDPLDELREIAAAAEKLAGDEGAFIEAFDAHAAADAARFQSALGRAGVADLCGLLCVHFCVKRCAGTCVKLCPTRPTRPVDAREVLDFTHAIARVAKDRKALERLLAIAEKEDKKAWDAELKQLELTPFCHQVCRFVCRTRCKRACRHLCARPLITRISSIPTAQFDAQGFGHGPSVPPFQVPPPNPAAGVGDHPVGASSWLMGVFNFPAATQHKLEYPTSTAGPCVTIAEPVPGYASMFPLIPVTRFPSGGGDPGWYDIADIPLSDGGPTTAGEKTLVYWTTPSDGLYYLRLRVRDGATEKVSAPRAVRVVNTAPPTPIIKLELKTPAGELKQLEPVGPGGRRAGGKLGAGGAALEDLQRQRGRHGLPGADVVHLDPWSDPKIVPCCYIVRIDIRDRAVLNNAWAGGHGGAGWEAIEIGF